MALVQSCHTALPTDKKDPFLTHPSTLSQTEKTYSQIEKKALSLVWGVKNFQNYFIEGHHFTLVTDHQPLKYIVDPRKAVPFIAAARLQCQCLFLDVFMYDKFRGTKQHANCDGLTHLPRPQAPADKPDEVAQMLHASVTETLPVTKQELRLQTRRDSVLSCNLKLAEAGWQTAAEVRPDVIPYAHHSSDISVHHRNLMWGSRVILCQPN